MPLRPIPLGHRLGIARKLDATDPQGAEVSARELQAATTVLGDTICARTLDEPRVRCLSEKLLGVYNQVAAGVSEAPVYPVAEALTRLSVLAPTVAVPDGGFGHRVANVLNELRDELPELRWGEAIPVYTGDGPLFATARQYDGLATLIVVNTGGESCAAQRIDLRDVASLRENDELTDRVSGQRYVVKRSAAGACVEVPALAPHQAMVLTPTDRRSKLAPGPTSVTHLDLTPAGRVAPSPERWQDYRFYFLMVDRFANGDPSNDELGWAGHDPSHPARAHGGDLRGVINKLDYIQSLGCNALWLNPVAQNFGAYHGYSIINGLAVDPSRGAADDLRELVDKAHARGMKVVLDVVPNHTAPVRDYPPGRGAFEPERIAGTRFRSDRPRPLPEGLRHDGAFHDQGEASNWNNRGEVLNGDFPGGLSDVNTEDPRVVETLIKTYCWWISRFDIDGFRVDTVKHAPKEFWDQFNTGILEHARSIGKENFLLMPEVLEGRPRDQAWAVDTVLPDGSTHHGAPLNHPLFFALKDVFRGETPSSKIGDVLRGMVSSFAEPTLAGNFADSHDFSRFLHDVGGNREAYEAALATVFAAPGMPVVYYGSEQGFSGGDDPWNREDMFANPALCYRTVPKPGGDNFDTSSPLFAAIQKLNNLRAKMPELRYGATEVRWERNDRPSLYAFARKLEDSEVILAANPTSRRDRAPAIRLDPAVFQPGDRLVDALHPEQTFVVGGTRAVPSVDVTLAAHTAALLTRAISTRAASSTNPADPVNPPAAAPDRPIIYQLLVRTFGNVRGVNRFNGDLATNGVGKFSNINDAALDQIKRQGHTHVYLSGVLRHATGTDYSDSGLPADDPDILKGRAGSPWAVKDYFDVSPDLADDPAHRLDEFRALVERIKAKGLEVMIDMIPNHVARSYESVVRPDLSFGATDDQSKFFDPKNNFFYLQDQPGRGLEIHRDPAGLLPGADGRFAREDGSPGHAVRVTGNNKASYEVSDGDWCETVKLNYGFNPFDGTTSFDPLPDTWTKMDEVIRYWQQMGVNGFRVDYAHVVPLEFWRWATDRAKARDPNFIFVGEAYEKSPDKVPGFTLERLIGAGFDAVYHAELFHGLREIVAGPKWANDIDGWLGEFAAIEDNLVHYAENHDEPRIAAPVRADDLWNSGLGDPKAGRPLAAVLFLTGRGPNLLYNGQEVGEPAAGAEGFGGDDARTTIFDYWTMPSHARWVGSDHSYRGTGLSGDEKALRQFYRRVNELARSPLFAGGERASLQDFNRREPDYGTGEHVYSFVRYDGAGRRALVVANFSSDQTLTPTVRIPAAVLRQMGIDDDQRFALEGVLGAAPSRADLSASALSTDGVTVELEPFGISVIQLDDVE